jgi:hypothetical protein
VRSLAVLAALTACSESKEPIPPSAEGEPDAGAPAHDAVGELKAALAPIVEAKNANDDAKRRAACMALEPRVSPVVAEKPEDKKVQELGAAFSAYCAEAVEARKHVARKAEPKAPVPELSPALKKMFNAKSLEADLKKAKVAVKKKQDPKSLCDRIDLAVKVLDEPKKKPKKVKKLLGQAGSFCATSGALGTARFHLDQAEDASKKGSADQHALHCTEAMATLLHVEGGAKAKLSARLESLCPEVYALANLLAGPG